RPIEDHDEVDLKARRGSAEAARRDRAFDRVGTDQLDGSVANAGRAAARMNEDPGIRGWRIGEACKAGARRRGELRPNAVFVEIDAVVPRGGDLRPLRVSRSVA